MDADANANTRLDYQSAGSGTMAGDCCADTNEAREHNAQLTLPATK
jgi:hypothetical protein